MEKKTTILKESDPLKSKTRLVKEGDIIGGNTPKEIEDLTVKRRIRSKINKEAAAFKSVVAHTPEDKKTGAENFLKSFPLEEQMSILKTLLEEVKGKLKATTNPDDELVPEWRDGFIHIKTLCPAKTMRSKSTTSR